MVEQLGGLPRKVFSRRLGTTPIPTSRAPTKRQLKQKGKHTHTHTHTTRNESKTKKQTQAKTRPQIQANPKTKTKDTRMHSKATEQPKQHSNTNQHLMPNPSRLGTELCEESSCIAAGRAASVAVVPGRGGGGGGDPWRYECIKAKRLRIRMKGAPFGRIILAPPESSWGKGTNKFVPRHFQRHSPFGVPC